MSIAISALMLQLFNGDAVQCMASRIAHATERRSEYFERGIYEDF